MPVDFCENPRLGDESVCCAVPDDIVELLRCPVCRGDLTVGADVLTCQETSCGESFPLSAHGPVLINEANSVFDIETFLQQEATFFKNVGWFRSLVSRCLPDPSANVAAGKVLPRFRDQLLERSDNPTVLVIGGSIVGDSIDVLIREPRIRLVETDVAIGPHTQVICDGHDLPFADASFDGVVVQAVLEHVVDPIRCVAEIHRVLGPHGLVYSDIPFMQQVHGREFDFTRYSRLGHRRLFRQFEEVSMGITCGPGMALAWTLRYFFLSFCTSPGTRALVSGACRLAFSWLIYLDRYLQTKPAANDAASAFYFLGTKSDQILPDRELIARYVGG